MAISRTRLHKRSSKWLSESLADAVQSGSLSRRESRLVNSTEAKVVSAARGLESAQRNITYAARQLRALSATNYRKPRRIDYEALILYHTAAALHETTVWRYRMIRFLVGVRQDLQRSGDAKRADVVKQLKSDLIEHFSLFVKERTEHVHGGDPFVPKAIMDIGMQQIVHGRDVGEGDRRRKEAARAYSEIWLDAASFLEGWGVYVFDMLEVSLHRKFSGGRLKAKLQRIGKRLDSGRVAPRKAGE